MQVAGTLHINWTWYLWYTINADGTITIHRHDRKHNERDTNHPECNGTSFEIQETSDRIAKNVILCDRQYKETGYKVVNPRHVFSYNDKV